MLSALNDFVAHCRVERRLADLTCKAYERDVRACIGFLQSQRTAALAEVRTRDMRAFLADEAVRRQRQQARRARSRRFAAFFASACRATTSRGTQRTC